MMIYMFNKPKYPNNWKDGNQTIFRNFYLQSVPDIECLIRLVKENIPDHGNNGMLRERLFNILWSYYLRANAVFWARHNYPRTWRIRLAWKYTKEWYHRKFNTKYFKSVVELDKIAQEVLKENESN